MKVASHKIIPALDVEAQMLPAQINADLVFVNGSPLVVGDPAVLEQVKKVYSSACILGCSSNAELLNGESYEDSVIVSAIEFEHSRAKSARIEITDNSQDEFESGRKLAKQLLEDDLKAVILFSEGLAVDCDDLINGLCNVLGDQLPIIGGLAGDVGVFEDTFVLDHDGVYNNGVVAVGLYGDRLHINNSTSVCPQDGLEVEITSARDNLIYEINGQPALQVYDDFITKHSGLALSSRLLFPLVIIHPETRAPLYFRTVFEYNTETNSLLTAGTIPEGPALLIGMTNRQDVLNDADATSAKLKDCPAEFTFIVNCAARKGILGSEWMQESRIIQQYFVGIPQHGFYSFGEFGRCQYDTSTVLHNQTLSITTLSEA